MIAAASEPESPTLTACLMEAICDPNNIEAALRVVVRNKGAGRRRDHRSTAPDIPRRAGWRSNINCSRVATGRNRCVGCKSRSRPAGHATSAFQR